MARKNNKNNHTKNHSNGMNTPPQFMQPLPDRNGHPGRAVSFTASAQDPDGDSVSYALINNPPPTATLDANTGAFTWTPAAADLGTWTITIQATDSAGLPANAQCHVFVTNQPPVIPPISPIIAKVGSKVTFNINATDPEGDLPLSYTRVSGPGMIDQAGQYTNNGVSLGSATVVIRVVDSLGAMSQASFTITGEPQPWPLRRNRSKDKVAVKD